MGRFSTYYSFRSWGRILNSMVPQWSSVGMATGKEKSQLEETGEIILCDSFQRERTSG